jgi:hypothetical protein
LYIQSPTRRDAEQDENDNRLVETSAVILASLDPRGCARAQMQDANLVLEKLLLPISFPWSQTKAILYKPLPRDIDDMSIIMNGDEEYSLPEMNRETYSAMDCVQVPKSIPLSSKRCDDPGVVELLTYVRPTTSQSRRMQGPTRLRDLPIEDPMIQGELSLRMYNEVVTRKRRREEFETAHTSRKLISFRVGSTSSRSTIFDLSDESSIPLLLQATYPKQIQDGVKRFGEEAYDEGINLGSYNSRPLPSLEAVISDPTSKNRFVVGRTRLVWSEREQSQSKSQRSPYFSILTGLRLDSNNLKRPLSVKVGIRINGVLIASCRSQGTPLLASGTKASEPNFCHSTKSVHDALDVACREVPKQTESVKQQASIAPQDFYQCSINVSKYVNEIIQNNKTVENNGQRFIGNIGQIRKPISIRRQLVMFQSLPSKTNAANKFYRICNENEVIGTVSELLPQQKEVLYKGETFLLESLLNLNLDVVPPRLDCLPTEDGRIHVTCTMPGKITYSTKTETDKLSTTNRNGNTNRGISTSISLLLNLLAAETDRCASCWNYKPLNNICSNCKYTSDTIFPSDYTNKWIHNVGKQWSDIDAAAPFEIYSYDTIGSMTSNCYIDKSCCHLCSKGTVGSINVVSCPAEGCNVRFHPVCAILVSAASEVQFTNNHNRTSDSDHSCFTQRKSYIDDDVFLCTQYNQSMIQTSFIRASNSTIHIKNTKTFKLPEKVNGLQKRSLRINIKNGTPETTTSRRATTSNHLTTATIHPRRMATDTTSMQSIALPIVFCPYHNPKRSKEYYGFYPNGCYINHDTIRIPPARHV